MNMLVQAAATAAITDDNHIQTSQEVNKLGREFFYKAFSILGLHYTESMSNFVLVKIGINAKDIYEKLLAKGIIVRYGGAWGLPEYVRVSVSTREENAILVGVMSFILQDNH
ncbi:hypothetical protein GCM10020331_065210 [Ectobacillus funiculus]